MTDPRPPLPGYYLRHVADQLRRRDVPVSRWLQPAGLSEADLADPVLTVPFAHFEQLVRDALTLSKEPALGLFVGERLAPATHGVLGDAVLSSATLRQAIGLFERFVPLRLPIVAVTLEVSATQARLCVAETCPLGDIQRPVLEAVLLSVKNAVEAISLGASRIDSVGFAFDAPDYAALARELLRCPVRYAQTWTGFRLPLALLDQPLRAADPVAFREAAGTCQRELDKLTAHTTLAARVQRLMLEQQTGFPSLGVTARLLRLPARTLHRRLEEEGTSFKQLLEGVRHTLALAHLRQGRFTVEEIAYALGYSDLSNFRRAFKRWEAKPPSAFRPRRLPEAG
ncbi:MAG: AraC family transcriptional regulator [Lysobacteraceae bacterium]|nr:MAG: AraC family transcriptional regulator [Xanthomonadaceae bacterium]